MRSERGSSQAGTRLRGCAQAHGPWTVLAIVSIPLLACGSVPAKCFGGSTEACLRLERDCDEESNPQSCVLAGRAYLTGKGQAFPTRALEVYRLACSADEAKCTELVAAVIEAGDRVTPDERDAALAHACDRGRGSGCRLLSASARWRQHAGPLMRLACDRGDTIACHAAADQAVRERRLTDALSLAEQGCELRDPASCSLVGALLIGGSSESPPAFIAARAAWAKAGAKDKDAVRSQQAVDSWLGLSTDACEQKCARLAGTRACGVAARKCFKLAQSAPKHGGMSIEDARGTCRSLLDQCVIERDADPVGIMQCVATCKERGEGDTK